MNENVETLSRKLLIRPTICINEGFLGYLKRVSNENGLSCLFNRREKIGSLISRVTMFGLLPEVQDHQKNEYIKYLDSIWDMYPHAWNHHYSRFCPKCFKASLIWQLEWELLFFDVCPRHECWLVDTCSSCGQIFNWERKDFFNCDCGAVLVNEPSEACPSALLKLTKILQCKIAFNAFSFPENDFISKLDVGKIQRLIKFFGTYANIKNNSRPQKISAMGSLRVSWAITSVAAEILVNWPESFFTMLKQIYENSDLDTTGEHRLNRHFGNFYDYLYSELEDKEYDFIRSAFETYIVANWRGQFAKRNKRICDSLFEKSVWVPASYAAKKSGISVLQIKSMVKSGKLVGEERILEKSGRCFLTVKRNCIEELKHQKSEFIDLSTMRRLLGLGKKRSSNICEIIFPDSQSPTQFQRPTWGISRIEIEELLSIANKLKVIDRLEDSFTTIGHVIRYWRWSDTQIANLIQQIQRHQFVLLGKLSNSVGIAGWVASKQILLDWFSTTFPNYRSGIGVVEVAKLFGIKQEVAYFLSRRGFLCTEVRKTKHGRMTFISQDVLDDFSRKYIFSVSIARMWKTTSRCVLKIFQQHDIYPVSGPNIDKGRQYLFEKTPQLTSILHQQQCNSQRLIEPKKMPVWLLDL